MKETLYSNNINGLYEFVFHEVENGNFLDVWFYSRVLKNINLEKKYSHHGQLINIVNKRFFGSLNDAKLSETYDISQPHFDDWYKAGCLAVHQYMVRRFY